MVQLLLLDFNREVGFKILHSKFCKSLFAKKKVGVAHLQPSRNFCSTMTPSEIAAILSNSKDMVMMMKES